MTTKTAVLLTGDFLPKDVRARLEGAFAVYDLPLTGREAFFAQNGAAAKARAVVTTGHQGADAALMDLLPDLKIVACHGVGYDGIDVEAATRRGVWVTNTPDVLTEDVADLALALMLAVVRRLPSAERYVRAGRWAREGDFPLTDRLYGRRLGLLGLGRIGGAIARRGLAFGMEISYHASSRKMDSPYRWAGSAEELAAGCDVLCAAAPATPQTRGLVDAKVLRALGKGKGAGYFVNIGRGSLVDEPALVASLSAGEIAGAALDVFADEPRAPQALLEMENVVLSPHQGSATVHTRRAMGMLAVDNVENVLNGKPPATAVNDLVDGGK